MDLVRDTIIDYDREGIHFPYYIRPLSFPLPLSPLPDPFYRSSPPPQTHPFYEYCKNTYGLTEEEIKYVWDQYKTIILDKINE